MYDEEEEDEAPEPAVCAAVSLHLQHEVHNRNDCGDLLFPSRASACADGKERFSETQNNPGPSELSLPSKLKCE